MRHEIQFMEKGHELVLDCPNKNLHFAVWNTGSGWLSCLSCDKIWSYMHAIDAVKRAADSISSAAKYLGWRGVTSSGIQPWLIPQWAEEFHANLLSNDAQAKLVTDILQINAQAIDYFHLGWSPSDFMRDKGWAYSNCLTIPIAPIGGSWCGIYFLGQNLLNSKKCANARFLGAQSPYVTCNPPNPTNTLLAKSVIDAILIAVSLPSQNSQRVIFDPNKASIQIDEVSLNDQKKNT